MALVPGTDPGWFQAMERVVTGTVPVLQRTAALTPLR